MDVSVESGAFRRLVSGDLAVRSEPEHAPSAGSLLGLARKRLSEDNPRAALAVYLELRRTFPSSPEASTVLVTLGKLELDLGAPERALAAFDAYAMRGGPLGPEALSGRVRALRALGRTSEERRAIEEYLTRHPTGFEAPAMKKRLSTLAPG
jgi:hypothetical protein